MRTPRRMPRILVLGLGGTWCMKRQDTRQLSPFEHVKVASELGESFDLLEQFPAVADFCHPAFRELRSIDSSNITPSDWTEVANYILDHEPEFDGIVVMQGTDTLSFMAAALSFALRGLDKPVIVSGGQLEMDALGTDASNNLINACRVASLSHTDKQVHSPLVKEIAVVFGSKIIRGTRCRKYSERDLEAFDSVNVAPLGRIRTALKLNSYMLRAAKQRTETPRQRATEFDPKVGLLHIHPGVRPSVVSMIGAESSGLVLAAYGAGNIPCSTPSFSNQLSLEGPIKELTAQSIPVVITTQCVTGQAEVGLYETGSAAKGAGAIIANDMTPECAFVKLSWLLANPDDWPRKAKQAARGGPGFIGAIRAGMLTNMVGEITENPELFAVIGC